MVLELVGLLRRPTERARHRSLVMVLSVHYLFATEAEAHIAQNLRLQVGHFSQPALVLILIVGDRKVICEGVATWRTSSG